MAGCAKVVAYASAFGRLEPVRNPENRPSERPLLVKADVRYRVVGILA
jgi:hypothetical protein